MKENKMETMTRKKQYQDLMAMDGARIRDLNVASAVDLVGATVGPMAATIGKVVGSVAGGVTLAVGLGSCPDGKGGNGGDPCTCETKTHYIEDATQCCTAAECNGCTTITEPATRTFTLTELFNDNTATVTDARTNVGRTLEQLGIPAKIKTAINKAQGDADWLEEIYFSNVFNNPSGNRVTITVENNITYTSYEADNKLTVRFNVDYLLSASADDLASMITTAVTEMNELPVARSTARDTIRMTKAPVDSKAIAASVIAQLARKPSAQNGVSHLFNHAEMYACLTDLRGVCGKSHAR
jgi:hypothetical protein